MWKLENEKAWLVKPEYQKTKIPKKAENMTCTSQGLENEVNTIIFLYLYL